MNGTNTLTIDNPFEAILAKAGHVTWLNAKEGTKQTKSNIITTIAKNDQDTKSAQTVRVEGLISDLALILVLGAIATLLFKKLKQPIVLGYIVAGFLAGPHFGYLPHLTSEANIDFWAQIGIIVLLFSLGLEFSFKKLMNVGGSAVVTALIIVAGMMGLGFVVGQFLDFGNIDCMFLGGMLSMSSTTIIIKAFTDLNMRQKKFAQLVFAVLICEDLFAVVMMVILSSVALNKTVESEQMLMSILKLAFFLIIWFTVGVFVIPSFFNRFRRFINDEMLLVISMGMCFLMAKYSAYSGFSMALGAFVMGSILAGTCEAEHIEKVTRPVKDLFGAVFFISVGMMVNPEIIANYAGSIFILSVVVIIGMIVFGTFGMLATGQPLRVAMQSGFSLTQIGEFAFIIASLGMSLGVLQKSIYPIVVAVSVVTTFFTPYFIKAADPCYNWVAKHLPERLNFLLTRYSNKEATVSETRKIWKDVVWRYSWRILLYSTLLTGIIVVSKVTLLPILEKVIDVKYGRFIGVIITLCAMLPFLIAMSYPSTRRSERVTLKANDGNRSMVPLVVMSIFRIIVAFGFITWYITSVYSNAIGFSVDVSVLILIVAVMSKRIKRKMHNIETKFINNLNVRELRRSGKGNNLVSDMHLAYVTVGYSCPFVGDRLRNTNLGKEYEVNVVSIQRGSQVFQIPTGDMRIFPGDQLGIIGTDEHIQAILPVIEDKADAETVVHGNAGNVEFAHFEVAEKAPIIGKKVEETKLREDYSTMLVAIQRGEDNFIKPTAQDVINAGDVLWLVGDVKKMKTLRTSCQTENAKAD
jgi:CPA2 family monovalent cation:H+ antiporter-2